MDPATNRRPGWLLDQGALDMFAVAGGGVTAYLRTVDSLLALSVIPSSPICWTSCARLSLARRRDNEERLRDLAQPGVECGQRRWRSLMRRSFRISQGLSLLASPPRAHVCDGSIDLLPRFCAAFVGGSLSLRAELSGARLGLVARAATLDLTHQNDIRAAALKMLRQFE